MFSVLLSCIAVYHNHGYCVPCLTVFITMYPCIVQALIYTRKHYGQCPNICAVPPAVDSFKLTVSRNVGMARVNVGACYIWKCQTNGQANGHTNQQLWLKCVH